jgi:hypothetical protein
LVVTVFMVRCGTPRQQPGHQPGALAHERGRHRGGELGERLAGLGLVRLLQPVHLRVDRGQALQGFGDVHGQVEEDRRDLVVDDAPADLLAHRHRDECAQGHPLGIFAAGDDQLSEATRHRGHHHVVDRAAERLADPADVVERAARVRPATVRPDRAVERGGRRGSQRRSVPAQPAGDRPATGERTPRGCQRGERPPQLLGWSGHDVERAVDRQPQHRRLRLRRPAVHHRWRWLALEVEHDGHQVDARDPVDHAVMDLADHRPLAVRQALDDPRLPQRPGPVQLLGHQPSHQPAQLRLAAGRRQRAVAHVVVEVEVRIVHPQRAPQVHR